MGRISRIDMAMMMALSMAEMSSCRFIRVGCVIPGADNSFVGLGYDGRPDGSEHCSDAGCLK